MQVLYSTCNKHTVIMFIISRKEKLSVNDVQLFANTDQFDTLTCTCIYSSTVKVQYSMLTFW